MKITSYLSSLKFDSNLSNKWYAKYITQVRLVIMLILSIVIMGLFAYFNLPRRLNPEIKIPIVTIVTVLPGASPEDIESLVTIPIEDKLNNLEGVDTLVSTSSDNSSVITLQFLTSVDGDKAKSDVKSAVDSVTNLPTDAKAPVVQKLDFDDQPIWNFAIITDKDTASLSRFSKDLQKKIEDISKIDRVVISGVDTQEVEVVVSPEKIKEYGINPLTLSQLIRSSVNSYPAGNISTDKFSFSLSIDKDVKTIDDIRNLQLDINGSPIRLGEIAAISFKSAPNQSVSLYGDRDSKDKKSVQFFVFKARNANIDTSEKEVKTLVEDYMKGNKEFSLITVSNSAEEIVKQFDELTGDFFFTVLLVFTLLLVFLGLKQALIASFTVPLTFLSSFAIINALGLSLNFLTMFALLIALGLLIDDTIVTVAAMTRYYATGKFTPAQTGMLVWRDFIVPLWSTTITTIWAFVPLLLATGIIGEFIKSIPIVVTATMISSTSIAVLITLPLMIIFLKPEFPKRVKLFFKIILSILAVVIYIFILPKNPVLALIIPATAGLIFITLRTRKDVFKFSQDLWKRNRYGKSIPSLLKKLSGQGLIDIEVLSKKYMVLIERILLSKHGKRNTLIAVVVFALVAYALVPLGFVKNEFFPKQDSDLLYISVEYPNGSDINVLNRETEELLKVAKKLPEVNFAVAESGQGFSANAGRSGASSNILITLHLTDHKIRSTPSYDLAASYRKDLANYTKGNLIIQEQSGGPPAGADLQITLLGDDLKALDQYSDQMITFMKTLTGVTNIEKSIKIGTSKIVFTPNKDLVLQSGLSVDQLALWFRSFASGFTLDSIKFDEDREQDIVFRMSPDTHSPEDLGRLSVPTPRGSVPLLSLGKLSLETNPTVINREDGKRSVTITASVLAGFNIQEKNKQLEEFAKGKLNLQSGYTWKTGGVNDENQKSVNSILQAMLISFLLILITMVIEFRSFRQTFIALAIIPLSIAGVFYIFALTHTPLSFPALIGVLALFGIVVTHAIVVIEKINDNRREGMKLKEAIVDAAGNRLEPVLLTSFATIAGLVPITFSDPLWRGLGGAIIAGLLFSGAIKLFFVPVTYYLLFKNDLKK